MILQLVVASFLFLLSFSSLGFAETWHVNQDCAPPGSGSVNDPFCSIQNAIDGAVNGDEIMVHDGIYYERAYINGKDLTLRSQNGPDVTVVDGSDERPGITLYNSDSIIQGFTAQNTHGSALYARNGTVTFQNCIVRNSRSGWGAGLMCRDANCTISDLLVENNIAGTSGGGMSLENTTAVIRNTVIQNNSATQGIGAGIYLMEANVQIERSVIRNNAALGYGGGIFANSTSTYPHLTVRDSIIADNTSEDGSGGAIHGRFINLDILNSTVAGNSSDYQFGGIYFIGPTFNLRNSIVWNNHSAQDTGAIHLEAMIANVNYSNVQFGQDAIDGNWSTFNWGDGNILTNPRFINPSNGNYHLHRRSTCINQGDPAFISLPEETDIDSETRIQDSRVDIGADETSPLGLMTAVHV